MDIKDVFDKEDFMLKVRNCVIVVLILLFLGSGVVLADNEIDMNLTSNRSVSDDANSTSTNSVVTNSTGSTSGNHSSSATVSSVSDASDGELGIMGIINILLITVGVILIFLAIAILIRLR